MAIPTVVSMRPNSNRSVLSKNVQATFSEPMHGSTITTSTFTVETDPKHGSVPVVGTVAYDALTRTATFAPTSPLHFATGFIVALTSAIKAAGGEALAPTQWVFSTRRRALPYVPPRRTK